MRSATLLINRNNPPAAVAIEAVTVALRQREGAATWASITETLVQAVAVSILSSTDCTDDHEAVSAHVGDMVLGWIKAAAPEREAV
jgi:hypothetical protein